MSSTGCIAAAAALEFSSAPLPLLLPPPAPSPPCSVSSFKLDPRPPVEEPPPAVETVSPEGRGEKRPRPDREETLVTQIDEPPSYEEALKQGLPTTRPIAPMATGVSKIGRAHV